MIEPRQAKVGWQAVVVVLMCVTVGLGGAVREGEVTISGTVTGPGGAAVAGATVEAMFPWGTQATATTDAAGQYQLSIAPGPVAMHVRAPVAARLADSYVDLGFKDASFTQDFQLRAGYLLAGVVRMPDGSAAASGLAVVASAISFKQGVGDWLKTSTAANGTFQLVAPPGVYWATVDQPEFYFSDQAPADLRAADVTDLVLTLSTTLRGPLPERPPDASKISFGTIDGRGEATVTGSAGAVIGLAHVVLINLSSLQQAHTVSEADGSFTTRIFAPPGSAILVKHGATPASFWDDLATGVSMKLSPFPGTIIVRPHTHEGGGTGIPFAAVGTSDYSVDLLPETTNSVTTAYALTGTLGPSDTFNPGDEITIQSTVRVYGPAIDASTDLSGAVVSGGFSLRMVANENGRPVVGGRSCRRGSRRAGSRFRLIP